MLRPTGQAIEKGIDMVVQDKDMYPYMRAHGCGALLSLDMYGQLINSPETKAHWRDVEGHWYEASYHVREGYFTVDEAVEAPSQSARSGG